MMQQRQAVRFVIACMVWTLATTGAAQAPFLLESRTSWTPERVREAIDAGGDVNYRYPSGRTPLMSAAVFHTSPAVLPVLLAAGADVEARTEDGITALMHAAMNNAVEGPDMVRVLLDAGARLEARDRDGRTALAFAARFHASADVVRVLLEAGADVDARTELGWTPLMLAAERNANPAVAKALLDAGADVEARDARGSWTPLMLAARRNDDPDLVSVLVDAGANVEAVNDRGWTPLMYAVERNASPEVVRAYLAAGASVDVVDRDDLTPLMLAARHAGPAVVRTLLDAGADVDARDDDVRSWTALTYAVRFNASPEVVRVLLDGGADLEGRDRYGRTPLMHAAGFNELPVVSVLLDAGAVLEAVDEGGRTPLMFAVGPNASMDVLDVLLDAGAAVAARNTDGQTAFDLAGDNRALRGTDVYWRLAEPAAPPQAGATTPSATTDSLTLDDGSVLAGTVDATGLAFATAFGEFEIALDDIAAFGDGVLELNDGTRLVGAFVRGAGTITASVGTFEFDASKVTGLTRSGGPPPSVPPTAGAVPGAQAAPVGLPTEAEAAAVFQARVDAVFGEGLGIVRDFTKVDGLSSVFAGVDYYDLEFTATVTYPRGVKPECSVTRQLEMFSWSCHLWNNQAGFAAGQAGLSGQGWREVGDSERVSGSVRFQKSERGWRTN